MALKVWIHVDVGDGGAPQRVCWYVGTSDQMVENAVRMHLHLARSARFLLRDADGDLVPVSSTLPHDHTFGLVVVDDGASTSPVHGAMHVRYSASHQCQQQRHKRRRVQQTQGDDAAVDCVVPDSISISDAADHPGYSSDAITHAHSDTIRQVTGNSPTPALRPRSTVYLVTRFLETFTRAIPNDDNINFIPSTGPYALYALYCHLFQDAAYHPKSQNSFYKMTSMQGKIDRQRVIRYYQCSASRTPVGHDGNASGDRRGTEEGVIHEYIVYKPEGKGPLLRKYVEIGTDATADDLVRAASFVQGMDLDPQAVVTQYARFLEGFVPISKAAFQAHTHAA